MKLWTIIKKHPLISATVGLFGFILSRIKDIWGLFSNEPLIPETIKWFEKNSTLFSMETIYIMFYFIIDFMSSETVSWTIGIINSLLFIYIVYSNWDSKPNTVLTNDGLTERKKPLNSLRLSKMSELYSNESNGQNTPTPSSEFTGTLNESPDISYWVTQKIKHEDGTTTDSVFPDVRFYIENNGTDDMGVYVKVGIFLGTDYIGPPSSKDDVGYYRGTYQWNKSYQGHFTIPQKAVESDKVIRVRVKVKKKDTDGNMGDLSQKTWCYNRELNHWYPDTQ